MFPGNLSPGRPSSVPGRVPERTFEPGDPPQTRCRFQFGGIRSLYTPKERRFDDRGGFQSAKGKALLGCVPFRVRIEFPASRERTCVEAASLLSDQPEKRRKLIFRSRSGTSIVVTGLFQDGMELTAFAFLQGPRPITFRK